MMIGEPPSEPQLASRQVDTSPNKSAEGPRDNKNRIISRLKNISKVVTTVNEDQSKGSEAHIFNSKVSELVKLGNDYTSYLETHIDEITDDRTFQAIASLAKTSLLMNIEQYAMTIRGIGDFVASHPELNDLNPPGKKDGPWSNIKESLYFSLNNDIREQFREGILKRASELIEVGDFSPRDVDHLERFLLDPKGRTPSEFIKEYVQQHKGEIKQWATLDLVDFQEYAIVHAGNLEGETSQNSFLRQLDEEIASIKPDDLKGLNIKYADRQKKLAFIRDLRFGRIDVETIKAEVASRASEITRRPDLKSIAPHLKQFYPGFRDELISTIGTDSTLRKEALENLLASYGLPVADEQFVRNYLEANLK